MISLVSPIYNEEENLPELYDRVSNAVLSTGEDFEFILVENGSQDGSADVIRSLRAKDKRVKLIRLSRNFGPQGAMLAGMEASQGEAIITLDGDLQHPPELIPRFIEKWKEGSQVVYTTKSSDKKSLMRLLFTKLFYWGLGRFSEVDLEYGQSDFRLIDRKALDVILKIPEKNKFFRGFVHWVGFKQTAIEYEVAERKHGVSRFSVRDYLAFALDGIFSFSTVPLRAFLWTGMTVTALSLLYGVFIVSAFIINTYVTEIIVPTPPGWATITASILFLGSVQLIGIGVLGEYLGRTYSQSKGRPDYIIMDKEF